MQLINFSYIINLCLLLIKVISVKPKKNFVGCPTKYKPEYAQMLVDHCNVDAYEVDADGKLRGNKFPSLASFAVKILVCRDTLHEWANKRNKNNELVHPDFSDAYKLAKEFQEKILVDGAMLGVYSSQFSVFAAKNILGWRDNKDLTIANPAGESFKTDVNMTTEEAYKKMLEG